MQAPRYTLADRHELPSLPGVYHFYNKANTLIYVGKAKNIKKRVASYFTQQKKYPLKTRKMIVQIDTIGFVLVNNEYDALILENNLIKAHQPRYNVLLKDGKTFPYLCITKGPFPRIVVTRQRDSSQGTYIGPFTSTRTMEQIQALIRTLFPLRSCNYHLSPANIAKGKFKRCLEYHLGNCLAPCVGLQEEALYLKDIKQVELLLKGNFQPIKKRLKATMLEAAVAKDFKKAQAYKEKLAAIDHYQARSLITHPHLGNFDVIAIVSQDTHAFVSYLYIKKGMVIFAQSLSVQKKLDEPDADLLSMVLLHFRDKAQSDAGYVLSNAFLATLPEGIEVVLPRVGDKRKLVDLALKNAFFFQKEYLNQRVKKQEASQSTLLLLQKALRLEVLPNHIECFDNANLQGTNPVAGMVCFKGGRPAKRDNRYFHIKTVTGANDFASMTEVVTRRYARLMKEQAPLPNLIIIDGGKGQLSAAIKALKKVGIWGEVAIIAIAKKLEAIYRPNDSLPLFLDKKSPVLTLLQRIRNAAHDFSTGFHKQLRLGKSFQSELETIRGLGPKTVEKLLATFGSLAKVKQAPLEKLTACVGKQKTQLLSTHFQQEFSTEDENNGPIKFGKL